MEDIDEMICECAGINLSRGSAVDDPMFVDIASNYIGCDETATEGLPVKIVCDDTSSVQIACDAETKQLVFIDTSEFPPQVLNFDGTPHTGEIQSCDQEYIQHSVDFCDDDDVYTRITCVNKQNATDVQTVWLSSGDVVCLLYTSPSPRDRG